MAAPIIAGVDKFTDKLGNWDKYLWDGVAEKLPVRRHTFMQGVGLIEIAVRVRHQVSGLHHGFEQPRGLRVEPGGLSHFLTAGLPAVGSGGNAENGRLRRGGRVGRRSTELRGYLAEKACVRNRHGWLT